MHAGMPASCACVLPRLHCKAELRTKSVLVASCLLTNPQVAVEVAPLLVLPSVARTLCLQGQPLWDNGVPVVIRIGNSEAASTPR